MRCRRIYFAEVTAMTPGEDNYGGINISCSTWWAYQDNYALQKKRGRGARSRVKCCYARFKLRCIIDSFEYSDVVSPGCCLHGIIRSSVVAGGGIWWSGSAQIQSVSIFFFLLLLFFCRIVKHLSYSPLCWFPVCHWGTNITLYPSLLHISGHIFIAIDLCVRS